MHLLYLSFSPNVHPNSSFFRKQNLKNAEDALWLAFFAALPSGGKQPWSHPLPGTQRRLFEGIQELVEISSRVI